MKNKKRMKQVIRILFIVYIGTICTGCAPTGTIAQGVKAKQMNGLSEI